METCLLRKRRKTDCGIDIVAQNFAAQRAFTCQQSLDGVTQQAATKFPVASDSRLHCFPKILG